MADYPVPIYPGGMVLTKEDQENRGMRYMSSAVVVDVPCAKPERIFEIYQFYVDEYSKDDWAVIDQQPPTQNGSRAGLQAKSPRWTATLLMQKTPRTMTVSISTQSVPLLERMLNKLWPEKKGGESTGSQ